MRYDESAVIHQAIRKASALVALVHHQDPDAVTPRARLVLELLELAADAVLETHQAPTPTEAARLTALATSVANRAVPVHACEFEACAVCDEPACIGCLGLSPHGERGTRHPGDRGLAVMVGNSACCSEECAGKMRDAMPRPPPIADVFEAADTIMERSSTWVDAAEAAGIPGPSGRLDPLGTPDPLDPGIATYGDLQSPPAANLRPRSIRR